MQKITLNLKRSQLKIIKSLLKIEYKGMYDLEEFIINLIQEGMENILANLTEEQGIEIIKDVAEQD